MRTRRTLSRFDDDEHKVGHERWLVSYADFITLLFAFFVVMYSVSQVNEDKYRSLSATLKAAFSESDVKQAEVNEPVSTMATLESELQEALSGFPVDGTMTRSGNENWLELSLQSESLFDSAEASPSDEARALFSTLAETLESQQVDVQVGGHTDSVPISTARFEDNWALSSARALSVVDILANAGVPDQRLSAVAYGETRPVADNATEDGRRANRRVVIRISAAQDVLETNDSSDLSTALSPDVEEESVAAAAATPSDDVPDVAPAPPRTVAPVKLRGGDLLFTSDPDLPRLRERAPEDD